MKYEFHVIVGINGKDQEWSYWCSGPVMALNYFHKFAQLERQLDKSDKKKVLKPKLRPHQYKFKRLFLRYNANPLGKGTDFMEENYDLPNTPNPDLHKPKYLADVTPEFDGMPASGEEALKSWL